MIDLSTIIKKSAGQVSCVLDDEVAILNMDRAQYFGLQGVAAHIWETLQEPRSVGEICDGVMEHFDIGSDVCRTDVSHFILSLREAGLVEIVE